MARFLVVLSLHDSSMKRLEVTIPALKSVLQSNSDKSIEAAFRSTNGDTIGYCLISDKTASHILWAIGTASIVDGRDNVVVFEIGADTSARGFTRLDTWLKRHKG